MLPGFLRLSRSRTVTEQLLTAAMLVVPAAGCVLAFQERTQRTSAFPIAAGLTALAAAMWLGGLSAGLIGSSTTMILGNWLTLPTPAGLSIQWAFVVDQPRALLVLATSLIVLLSVVSLPGDGNPGILATRLKPLYPLSVLAILTTNLILLLSAWILIDCCIAGWRPSQRNCHQTTGRRGNPSAIIGTSSALLLLATLMAAARFQTLDVQPLLNRAASDGRVDAVTVLSGLCVIFVAAVAVRSACFPALIRTRRYVEQSPHSGRLIVALAGVLPGISLAISILPLSRLSPDGLLLIAMLGLLTSVTSTGIFLAQDRASDRAALLFISATGLTAVAFAPGQPSGGSIAAVALFSQLTAVSILDQRRQRRKWGPGAVLAMVVAVSGIAGANAILASIELMQNSTARVSASGLQPGTPSLLMLWWGIVISQFLWGIAITTLVSSPPPRIGSGTPVASGTLESTGSRSRTLIESAAALLAFGSTLIPIIAHPAGSTASPERLFAFGAATPACLLGVVITWLITQSSTIVRERVTGSVSSLTQLGRNWFYLDDVFSFGVVLPVRGLAWVIETGDRKISGGTSEDGWKQSAVRLAGSLEFLRSQPATYYGLTLVLLVVGLMWSLL